MFLWLTVFAVGTRAMMTLYYVPHVSLGAELSDDFNERTEVVAYRYFSATWAAFSLTSSVLLCISLTRNSMSRPMRPLA